MQEIYKFNKNDFDENGFNKFNGKLFCAIINEWEVEFNKAFYPLVANHLFGNSPTMKLLESCFFITEPEDFGMDGQFDFETNIEIDKHNPKGVTYALGSGVNEDEPVFLIIDSKMYDGTVILKYLPDDDDENDEPEIPVEENKIKKVLILTPKN